MRWRWSGVDVTPVSLWRAEVATYTVIAFLVAWQERDFDTAWRPVLSALTAAAITYKAKQSRGSPYAFHGGDDDDAPSGAIGGSESMIIVSSSAEEEDDGGQPRVDPLIGFRDRSPPA